MGTTVVILIVVVVVLLVIALAAAGLVLSRRRRSKELEERYGPEYERSLAETGDRRATEAQLEEREKRHDQLDVRDLRPEERERYSASWTTIQQSFVDDPVQAVHQADSLVTDIMRTRGYPVDDFERRAEDISVEHPQVVAHYRSARDIRQATENGTADTEQQRHAVTSYRELIDALLGSDHSSGSDNTNGHHAGVPTTEEQTR